MSFQPLALVHSAALTSVGLDAAQSCAAIRAGIRRFTAVEEPLLPDDEPRLGSRISAAPGLRRTEAEWLLNLSARAVADCLGLRPDPRPGAGVSVEVLERAQGSALLWMVPEAHRAHELSARDDGALLRELEERLGATFSPASRVFREGAGSLAAVLGEAQLILAGGRARRCIVGGVDSLLRRADYDRLEARGRLLRPGTPQGLVPGEAAAFVVVERAKPKPSSKPQAGEAGAGVEILGVGAGIENETVLEGGSSVGDGLVFAFSAALASSALKEAELGEADLDFVAGNFNGEHYDAWESAHSRSRCFRTRRERLPTLWPAASTGEVGAAGGVLALIAAADAIAEGYAPGKVCALELRSEGRARSVVVLGRPPRG